MRGRGQRLHVPHGLDGHAERLGRLPDLRDEQQVAHDVHQHRARLAAARPSGNRFDGAEAVMVLSAPDV